MTVRRRGAAVGARRIDDRPQRTALVAGAAFLILAAFTVAARAETVITAWHIDLWRSEISGGFRASGLCEP
jgi:hypothetical protein